jgi:hypothetical protein
MAGFGIYALSKRQFVSKFSTHGGEFCGPPLCADTRAEVEGWLDSPGWFNGLEVEVRPDPPAEVLSTGREEKQ